MALNLANVVLTDTFNTWRVRTNDIIAAAFEVESATPTTVTTPTTFGSNTTLAGTTTTVSSNASFTGANVDIVATVDINNSKIRIVDNDMTITGELTANSFTGDGSALTAVDAATLDSIDSASFLRSDAADAKTTGDLTFNDNVKALFGTAGDLEIFHSGSNSLINDAGGGNLKLQLAGSDKLEVTGFGLDATGKLAVSGDVSANAFIGDGSGLTNAGATVTDKSDNVNYNVIFTDETSGAHGLAGIDNGEFTFNPSTGTVTATNFAGDVTGSVTGNADTATALETARNIAGNSFDGTGDITISASDITGINQDLETSDDVRFDSFGVGTNASGTTGEIRATNNITAFFSDKRLKENITELSYALEKLNMISGVLFTPNETAGGYGYDTSKEYPGVIAQEVQETLPQAVVPAPFDTDYDENGNPYSVSGENYMTVQYEKLIPLLIEAIKELNKKVDSLGEK